MAEIKPVYTLADLEDAEQRLADSDSGRHSNPGRTQRRDREARERVSFIRDRLIEQGDLPRPSKSDKQIEADRIQEELNRLYPNAESKRVVEFKGERYIRRYSPLGLSRSRKTVKAWDAHWEKVDPSKS